jgi:hypothetical protein
MSLPEWMPPLPTKDMEHFCGWHGRIGMEKTMFDYALSAVEAYKASLKPVAWVVMVRDEDDNYNAYIEDVRETDDGHPWIPLYRLDGGDDEQQ